MLKIIGNSCCTKWSQVPKISNYLFHTRMYSDGKQTPKIPLVLDFVSKYNEQETERILNVLNNTGVDELTRYDIAKTRIHQMAKYRNTKGPFKTIEQVLEVENFGAKVLEKFVVSIAASSNERKTLPDTNYKPSAKLLNYIATPALSNEKRQSINTVTSIFVSSNHISWAQIESSGRLLLWDSFDAFESAKHDNFTMLHDLALKVCNKLPGSDVYVVEGIPSQQSSLNNQQKSSFSNVQCLQLNTMLVTLLATQFNHSNEADSVARWTSIDNCFYLRRQIPAKLFDLLVGNESVSGLSIINQIINNTISKSLAHIPPITIEFNEMEMYKSSDAVKKEALSQALLMSITFTDLIVNHNPLSLKKMEQRGSRRL